MFICSSCSRSDQVDVDDASRKPVVYTVNYPLRYFAQRIAGDTIDVVFPEIDGDPAFWKPGPEEISRYQEADLILLNGANYAKWVDKVSLPQSKLVDTSAAFKDDYLEIEQAATHTHGPGGEHAHGDLAFTTWLDLTLAVRQVDAIANVFTKEWPEHAGAFKANHVALERDLLELDEQIKLAVSRHPDLAVVFSHPVYQYFARRYGLNGESVHWEPDAMPEDKMWRALEAVLKEHPAEWMIWEGEPLPEIADKLQAAGVSSVVFDPCGNMPASGDFLSVMRENVERIRPVFER